MSFLRNPLTWHKRYVMKVYDMPARPSSFIGRAGHTALEHFYAGLGKEAAVELGLEYLRGVEDGEIDFGVIRSKSGRREKRAEMEEEYLQAIGFYLKRPPRYSVLGIEFSGVAHVPGLPLPVKAISDLVVESKVEPGAVDIVDHKFVDSFSKMKQDKPMFILQAFFNYYTVLAEFKKPVRRFIIQECRRKKNRNAGPQMRKYVIDFKGRHLEDELAVFHRLLRDATYEIGRKRAYLPNPSDIFEGTHSYDIYRLGLEPTEEEEVH
jgi:hypothetical protein